MKEYQDLQTQQNRIRDLSGRRGSMWYKTISSGGGLFAMMIDDAKKKLVQDFVCWESEFDDFSWELFNQLIDFEGGRERNE